MSVPFKIVVAANLAPGRPAQAVVPAAAKGADALMVALEPSIRLADPTVEVTFRRLEDFTPPALVAGRPQLEDPAAMTALLHHPAFQALESAWRGLDFLLNRLPADGVVVEVLNTPPDELRQRLFDQVFTPEYNLSTEVPAGLIVVDQDFDHKPASLAVMEDLTKMGQSLAVPILANTTAAFFGVSHLLHVLALSDLPGRLGGAEHTSYLGFRQKDQATWLSLGLNRFLLRPPHEGLGYTEPASASQPQTYLWGRPAWLIAANVARAWAADAHPAQISGMGPGGVQARLYHRELPITRADKVTTPLEAVFPLAITEMLPYFGLSALTQTPPELGAPPSGDMAYPHLAVNLRHFTDPTGEKPGLLTVYTTLAYSLILGRVSNLAARLAPAAGGDADQLKQALQEHLGGLAQGELTVTAQEGALSLKLAPELKIHEKDFTVELDLPLQ